MRSMTLRKSTPPMMRMILKNSIVALLLLVLAGCAIKRFQPAPGDYLIEDRFAIVRTDSLVIALRPQTYRSPNGTVGNIFFSIFMSVQNISTHTIELKRNAFFVLVDNKQARPLPIDWITIGFSSPISWDWQDPMNPIQNRDPDWQQIQEDRYDMIASAFSFGELLSGARMEGYVFYDPPVTHADSIEVDIFGQRVKFVKK